MAHIQRPPQKSRRLKKYDQRTKQQQQQQPKNGRSRSPPSLAPHDDSRSFPTTNYSDGGDTFTTRTNHSVASTTVASTTGHRRHHYPPHGDNESRASSLPSTRRRRKPQDEEDDTTTSSSTTSQRQDDEETRASTLQDRVHQRARRKEKRGMLRPRGSKDRPPIASSNGRRRLDPPDELMEHDDEDDSGEDEDETTRGTSTSSTTFRERVKKRAQRVFERGIPRKKPSRKQHSSTAGTITSRDNTRVSNDPPDHEDYDDSRDDHEEYEDLRDDDDDGEVTDYGMPDLVSSSSLQSGEGEGQQHPVMSLSESRTMTLGSATAETLFTGDQTTQSKSDYRTITSAPSQVGKVGQGNSYNDPICEQDSNENRTVHSSEQPSHTRPARLPRATDKAKLHDQGKQSVGSITQSGDGVRLSGILRQIEQAVGSDGDDDNEEEEGGDSHEAVCKKDKTFGGEDTFGAVREERETRMESRKIDQKKLHNKEEDDDSRANRMESRKKNRKAYKKREHDDDDQCILSVEPGSAGSISDVKRSKSYIINEPQGGIVDKFVEGSANNSRSTSVSSSTASSSKGVKDGHDNNKNTIIDKKKQQREADRLACNFSVEPLSPMSEISRRSARQSNAQGIMAMLEQYLPDDVSDGPLHSVFDQYIPTFTSSTSTCDNQSSGHVSSCSTTHPLRFVNELALVNSTEEKKKSKKEGNAKVLNRQESMCSLGQANAVQDGCDNEMSVALEHDYEVMYDSHSCYVMNENGIEVTESNTFVDEPPNTSNQSLSEHSGESASDDDDDDDGDDDNSTVMQDSIVEQSGAAIEPTSTLDDQPPYVDTLSAPGKTFETTSRGKVMSQGQTMGALSTSWQTWDASSRGELAPGQVVGQLRKLLASTSIQVISPKYRGWKPEELEVILLESPQNDCQLQTLPTAATETSSHSSFVRGLETLQIEKARNYSGSTSPNSGYMSSHFSIPHIGANLSDDSEDPIPIPPGDTFFESSDAGADSDFDHCQETPRAVQQHQGWNAKPLAPKSIPTNNFFRDPPSSTSQCYDTQAYKKPTKEILRPQSHYRKYFPSIRHSRSEDIPCSHQRVSELDSIIEQIDPPPMDESCDNSFHKLDPKEDKENGPGPVDMWQSSLDSIRQLKATSGSQRQLLTRLIAERNGANATATTAKTKLTKWSENHHNILMNKDHEIEGLRRANRVLRVQVAQVGSTKITPENAPDSHAKVTELTRKLHDLDAHGSVVDREQIDREANVNHPSRLYRSEKTLSSEFLDIDNCVFELKSKEVTTLQVSDIQETPTVSDQTGESTANTDHEIQVAIAKIVAKETAFLKQKVETLEQELEVEISKQNNGPSQEERTCDSESTRGCAAIDLDQREGSIKESALAKWKSEPNQREVLSMRLEKATDSLKKTLSENERLKQALQQSRSANQEFKEKELKLQDEMLSLKKSSEKVLQHTQKELKYYKQKVMAIEEKDTRFDSTAQEATSMRDLVETLQTDYAEAERRRLEATSKCDALDLELKQTKRDLESRNLDNDDLLKKTEQLFAAKLDCDEKLFLLECQQSSVQNVDAVQKMKDDAFLQHYKRSVTKLEQEVISLRENEKRSSTMTRLEIATLRELTEKLHRDREEARQERDEATESLRDCEKRRGKLQSELENSKVHTQEIVAKVKQLEATKKASDEKMAALETVAAQLRLKTQTVSVQADGNIEMFKLNVVKLENELVALKGQYAQDSEKATKEAGALNSEVSRLRNELSVVSKEKDTMASDLEKSHADKMKLEQDLEEAKQETERLTNEVKQLLVTKEDHEARLAALRSELNTAHEDRKRNIEENRECIEQHRRQIENLEATVKNMKHRNAGAEIEKAALEEARQVIASKEECIRQCRKDLEEETEKARNTICSKEDRILELQKTLFRVEGERDAISSTCDSVTIDLERAKLDLESRILDNKELTLRVEQLFAAKEECEEKIASLEGDILTKASSDGDTTRWSQEKEEAYLMAQMHISTLQNEVEELRAEQSESAAKQEDAPPQDDKMSDDVYRLNREKQAAVAKCAFLAKENEKLSDMLDCTRTDLSESLIEISRLEMDLDDASNGLGCRSSITSSGMDTEASIQFLSDQNDLLSKKLDSALSDKKALQDQSKKLELEFQSKFNTEKQKLLQKIRSLDEGNRDNEESFLRVKQEKHDLLNKIRTIEKEALERAREDLSSASEKRALMDEIKRLEELRVASEAKISSLQASLEAARGELSEMKGAFIRKQAQERSSGGETYRLRNRVSELEENLRYSEKACTAMLEKFRREEQARRVAAADLERSKRKVSSTATEAGHLKMQISDMEQKLCSAEDSFNNAMKKFKAEEVEREKLSVKCQQIEAELRQKEQEVENLSAELEDALDEKQEKAKKHHEEVGDERKYRLQQKQNELKLNRLNTALAASQHNEAELRREMKSAQERDINELLSLREQVATLQNDAQTTEQKCTWLSKENQILSSKHKQVCNELEYLQRMPINDPLEASVEGAKPKGITSHSTVHVDSRENKTTGTAYIESEQVDKEKHNLSTQLANTRATLEDNNSFICQLEAFLQKLKEPQGVKPSPSMEIVPQCTGGSEEPELSNPCGTQSEQIDEERDILESRLAEAQTTLQKTTSRIVELEEFRQRTLGHQDKFAAKTAVLQKALSDMQGGRRDAESSSSALHQVGSNDAIQTDEEKSRLQSQLADAQATLETNKSRMTQLETFLHKTLEEQNKYVDQIDFLQKALHEVRNAPRPLEPIARESTLQSFDEEYHTGRIAELEGSLEQVAQERQKHAQMIEELRQEMTALKLKSSSAKQTHNAGILSTHQKKKKTEQEPIPLIIQEKVPISSVSMLDPEEEPSECDRSYPAIGDMSVNSKLAMSMTSSVATPDIVEKHSLYARKVNHQLGVASEREEEVSRKASTKMSLLIKEISKLCDPNVTRSLLDDISTLTAVSESMDYFVSGNDPANQEYDLECRLADVAQLSGLLEQLIVDKKKSENKLKALYQTNHDYLKEVTAIVDEKDSVLKRQGDVIDTLRDELAVLHKRDKIESRSLMSEITLLQENLSHLQEQFDHDHVVREQAANRLEIAIRESKSLEAALKQNHSERHHCQKRLPKLSQDFTAFYNKMEARIENLRNEEPTSQQEDKELSDGIKFLKIAVEDLLSYYYKKGRKELRMQTLNSSSSDTGEAEYFITLNDFDYQLLLEQETEQAAAAAAAAAAAEKAKAAAMNSKSGKKSAMKAKAKTQQRFVC